MAVDWHDKDRGEWPNRANEQMVQSDKENRLFGK